MAVMKSSPVGKSPSDMHDDAFQILGHSSGIFFYLPKGSGQVVELRSDQHVEGRLLALASRQWWEQSYPSNQGCDWRMAQNALIQLSYRVGIYNPDRVRGRGGWWDSDSAALHLGDRLIIKGEEQPMSYSKQYIYESAVPIRINYKDPLSTKEAKIFSEICDNISWDKTINSRYLAGWCAIAPICGALNWRPHIWITGGAGVGKAQPHSAKVLTPSGWSTMGDISVGDIVTTPDNGYGKVTGKYHQGNVPIYKFTFSDGRSTRATGNHLWKVRINGDWRIRNTMELIDILGRNSRGSEMLAVPLSDALGIVGNNKTHLPIHPYALGVLLGDGHLARDEKGCGGAVMLTSFDSFIVEKTRALLSDIGLGVFGIKRNNHFRVGDLSRYGRKTRGLIKDLRLLGSRSHNKFIPKQYLESSIEDRIHILQGLMDTDGTVGTSGSSTFCSTSKQLADDISYIVRSLGGIARTSTRKPSYTYKGKKLDGRTAYIVNIRISDRSKLFSLPRKLERVEGGYQYAESLYLNIKSITPDGYEDASCISIDHPSHLYVTDDFVVTHNSFILDKIVRRIIGDIGLSVQSATTEAGLRQTLRHDARPVMFDEIDGSDMRAQARIQNILELARQASSDSGASLIKGTVTGDAQTFKIRSCFAFSSIGVSATSRPDETRITVLGIRADGNQERFARLADLIADTMTDEYIQRFTARSVRMIPIIRENARIFATAAAKVLGSQRAGDQVGALLAGAYSLHVDRPVTIKEATEWIDKQDWSENKAQGEDTDEWKCLSYILQQIVKCPGKMGPTDRSIAELMDMASGRADSLESERAAAISTLGLYGMRGDPDQMVISATHNAIAKILRETEWAKTWARTLGRLPGAKRTDGTVRFGSVKSRGVEIPYQDEKLQAEIDL